MTQYCTCVRPQIFVADQMNWNIRLIEPTCNVPTPARQFLPRLSVFTFSCAPRGILVIHEANGVVDAAVIVIGERRRHVARISYHHNGAIGATRAGE